MDRLSKLLEAVKKDRLRKACWDGYEAIGTKTKAGRQVPNCVPVKEEAEGRSLNKPVRSNDGKKKFHVFVKNAKGNVVKVGFGDPNMEIKRDDPERRKNFRARHNCDSATDKTTPRYWSCRQWRAGKKVEG